MMAGEQGKHSCEREEGEERERDRGSVGQKRERTVKFRIVWIA